MTSSDELRTLIAREADLWTTSDTERATARLRASLSEPGVRRDDRPVTTIGIGPRSHPANRRILASFAVTAVLLATVIIGAFGLRTAATPVSQQAATLGATVLPVDALAFSVVPSTQHWKIVDVGTEHGRQHAFLSTDSTNTPTAVVNVGTSATTLELPATPPVTARAVTVNGARGWSAEHRYSDALAYNMTGQIVVWSVGDGVTVAVVAPDSEAALALSRSVRIGQYTPLKLPVDVNASSRDWSPAAVSVTADGATRLRLALAGGSEADVTLSPTGQGATPIPADTAGLSTSGTSGPFRTANGAATVTVTASGGTEQSSRLLRQFLAMPATDHYADTSTWFPIRAGE